MLAADAVIPRQSAARERILNAALVLFYRDGIRATGVDRLIAEAGVTKVTFYRHFPGKDDLITAFLEARHLHWMAWFSAALQRHGGTLAALAPALGEWLHDPDFRGCAFINSVGELGQGNPDVKAIAQRHKREMTALLATLLPRVRQRKQLAQALTVAVDGAIVQAQITQAPEEALAALTLIGKALGAARRPAPPSGGA